MQFVSKMLVAFVAIEHICFLVLEMFLWTKPLGMKIFRNTPEVAQQTATLAANQGLYNGFLAAGLLYSLISTHDQAATSFQIFFLACVAIAGIYGGWSVNPRIFWTQAVPAMLTLALVQSR